MPARLPVNRRPLATPWVTSRDFIKPQLLLPPSLRLRTTAQAAMSLLPRKGPMPVAMSHLKKTMKGCSSPAIWRRLSCRMKIACAMQAQEVETWRCFTCNQLGNLQRDHWKYEEKNGNGPLQPKGPPLNKLVQERVKVKPPPLGRGMSQTNPPK